MEELRDSTLSVILVPEKNLREFSYNKNNVLAAIYYGDHIPAPQLQNCLQVLVPLPQVGDVPLVEVWTSNLPHEVNQSGNICFANNSDLLFGSIKLQESKTDSLGKQAYCAYKEILSFTDRIRFPFLIRCWNYFPNINLKTNGIERYKLFCEGRHGAFAEKYKSMDHYLPAASAVGTKNGSFTINFIAARRNSGKHIENPRQLNAYRYPSEYGKRSPSFSRATYVDLGRDKHLYVAGTASIVGHKSCHKNNPLQQIHEIHRNLDSLLDNCSLFLSRNAEKIDLQDVLLVKTYIRNAELLPLIRNKIEERLVSSQSSLYLVGDICRSELLLEIEGIWLVNSFAHVSDKNNIHLSGFK